MGKSVASAATLRFEGAAFLRQRLLLSTLTGIPIDVREIRPGSAGAVGLSPGEVSLLRLLDRLTDGTTLEINETGTRLKYRPGLVVFPMAPLVHDCVKSDRTTGFFIEPVLLLAPFARFTSPSTPLNIIFRNTVTDSADPRDPGLDALSQVGAPLLRKLTRGDDSDPVAEIRINHRGSWPIGAGEVSLTVHPPPTGASLGTLPAVDLTDPGKIKRIRGVAFAHGLAPAFANRMVDTARGILNDFTADVYIFTDHKYRKHPDGRAGSGKRPSPGFGLTLVAESTTHCLLSADSACSPLSGSKEENEDSGGRDPEEVAKRVLNMVLEEVSYGGCIDTSFQCLTLITMALAEQDRVGKVRFGKLSERSVALLRDIKQFTGVVFKVQADKETGTVLLSCVGSGQANVARTRF